MKTIPHADGVASKLPFAICGLALALLTLLFGQGMGIVFGLNEDAIKGRLAASAAEVRESVYHNDDVAIKAVLDKSWTYMKRAHLHAGGMGTTALALIILTCFMGASRRAISLTGLGLGGGGLGYSLFWMWAGIRAPMLGGTGAAKESLKWLAMPTAGAFVTATFTVLLLLIIFFLRSRGREAATT